VTSHGYGGALRIATVVVAIAANVAYVAGSVARNAVRFDSGYNLTVSRNLAQGLGYTGDGLLSGGAELTPFDPGITTGPTVLVPLAAGYLFGDAGLWIARIAMCGWFVALLIALFLIGRRVGGTVGGAVAMLAPLLFDVTMGIAEEGFQGPTDVLGEIPLTALLAFAVVAVIRRPYLAAALVGLAALTKTVALIAAPAIVIAALIVLGERRIAALIGRAAALSAIVLAPIVAWQLVTLASLGFPAYVDNLRFQAQVFRIGGSGLEGAAAPLRQARLLLDAWHLPAAVAGVILLLAVVVAVALVWRSRRTIPSVLRSLRQRPVALTLLAIAAIGVPWLLWWLLFSTKPYPRYVYPALVLILAAALALAVRELSRLLDRAPARPALVIGFGVPLALLVAWLVGANIVAAWNPASTTIQHQLEASRVMHEASDDDAFDYDGLAAFPNAISMVSGLTAMPLDGRSPERPMYFPGGPGSPLEWVRTSIEEHCGTELFEAPFMYVCEPRPAR